MTNSLSIKALHEHGRHTRVQITLQKAPSFIKRSRADRQTPVTVRNGCFNLPVVLAVNHQLIANSA
ncbi:hypothetical protein T265_03469 [Opisthorchis viverrini]|uniref:Uncharacterized protein n=1 Tax=Opisthorchis viverrini TaxID=6198 RepID=A0A074ZVS2_OPIVI|nr:hypothetical protein T265_03469 [Opisthorchis viverrini]KER29987.1 hypothetical protein T265_03469 [Opisthorchis viverrini]